KDKTESVLDLIWEVLEKSILEIVMKHILKKKIYKTKAARDGKKRPKLDKLIVELDGSLVRTSTKKGRINRMGASWVQVGLDKEKILDADYMGT
ncbi:27782_t:CDS:2, partial [Gigaspora margarita]